MPDLIRHPADGRAEKLDSRLRGNDDKGRLDKIGNCPRGTVRADHPRIQYGGPFDFAPLRVNGGENFYNVTQLRGMRISSTMS